MQFLVFAVVIHAILWKNLFRIISVWNQASNGLKQWTTPHNQFLKFQIKNEYPKAVKRKYVLSLTTSPSRIKHLKQVLFNFRLSQQDRIVLNLPDKFRNVEDQDDLLLEKLQKSCPKLFIHRYGLDTGPEMKLLGCIPVTTDDECIIVIDDDTLQKNTLIEDQDEALDLIEASQVPEPQLVTPSAERIYGILIQPGQCSLCVPRRMIPRNFTQIVSKQKQVHKLCNLHDDFTMGAAFQDARFVRIETKTGKPLQLPQGFSNDALHMQSMSFVKHLVCADNIWASREQCAIQKPSDYAETKRQLIQSFL